MARQTITIDDKTLESVQRQADAECIPLATMLAASIKRYIRGQGGGQEMTEDEMGEALFGDGWADLKECAEVCNISIATTVADLVKGEMDARGGS